VSGVNSRRDRLYQNYASTHAGQKKMHGEARVFRRDIAQHLPSSNRASHRIVDLGCGQGQLVAQLVRSGYTMTRGIDISPEQVELAHAAGITGVECGDYRELLARESGRLSAVIATDFVEHFNKDEILQVFDGVRNSLTPGGVFIVRSPNGTSPFFGNYQFSDFTHETVFTPRSFSQVSAIAGFARSTAYSCGPSLHGVKSAIRAGVWTVFSTVLRAALAAETGMTGHIITQNFIGVATA
jgi:2-polyprenyl-3-methyl-5-hydroxy-6-metoxy-1,4-benzoquinol methylase